MGFRYDSRVVIYDRRDFIWLATDLLHPSTADFLGEVDLNLA